jgi:hypothetical protein
MDDRDRAHLELLLGHAAAAIGYAKARGRRWWKNPETVDAVLMRITQVGEEARKTSPGALAEVSNNRVARSQGHPFQDRPRLRDGRHPHRPRRGRTTAPAPRLGSEARTGS